MTETTPRPGNPDHCTACIAYLEHYPLMVDGWECLHGGNEYQFMLALADAVRSAFPDSPQAAEFADPGWRAAQFLDDADVASDCGGAPYAIRVTHNAGSWQFLALVNDRHLIGIRNEEGAELEHIADLGGLIAAAPPIQLPDGSVAERIGVLVDDDAPRLPQHPFWQQSIAVDPSRFALTWAAPPEIAARLIADASGRGITVEELLTEELTVVTPL
jgi:hypothetical protein